MLESTRNGIAFGIVFILMSPLAMTAAQSSARPTHTQCINCHVVAEIPREDSKPVEAPRRRDCVACHSDVLRTASDSQSAGGYAQSSHLLDAHAWELKIAPLGGKFFDRMDCLTCHVPHDEGQPKLLRLDGISANRGRAGMLFDSATQLCLKCHPVGAEFRGPGRGYVRHPVGIPVNKPGLLDRSQLPPLVDVRGTQDPSDDVIGCTTCHYVHTSKNSFLLRWGLAELSAACLKCHPDVAPSAPGNVNNFMTRR